MAYLATDGQSAYFGNITEIDKLPLTGGTRTFLAATTSMGSITVDGGYVYWSDGSGIHRVPFDGGQPTLVSNDTSLSLIYTNIATDGVNVYWGTSGTNLVMKAPVVGGPATILASNLGAGATSIAVDATAVYWTQSNGNVMKTNK